MLFYFRTPFRFPVNVQVTGSSKRIIYLFLAVAKPRGVLGINELLNCRSYNSTIILSTSNTKNVETAIDLSQFQISMEANKLCCFYNDALIFISVLEVFGFFPKVADNLDPFQSVDHSIRGQGKISIIYSIIYSNRFTKNYLSYSRNLENNY